MDYRTNNIDAIKEELNTDPANGLSSKEVEEYRQKYGSNEFEEDEGSSLLSKIMEQFKEVMNLVLLFAGFLSLYISFTEPDHGFAEPIVIFLIIVINMAVTIYQEGKAEDALEALKDMSAPKARVIRDGEEQEIEATEVVQGDILLLNAGDAVSADVRLTEANNLQAEEAALTGESVPVDKDANAEVEEDAPVGDVLNTAFSGTSITNGNGKGIVVGVGMDSEMGSIAGMLMDDEDTKTPLQQRIDRLAKILAVVALVAGVIIFATNYFNSDIPALENLMIAVTMGIAAVPETLPVIVTVTLAYGVRNMADRHAIIRNMPAVETLGSASIIASDKTGTLTQNKMSIQKIWTPQKNVKEADEEFTEDEEWMLKMMALASNAERANNEEEGIQVNGDPTEAAIIQLLEENDWSKKSLDEEYTRVKEYPFDSEAQRMTTIHEYGNEYIVISKGAFERISESSQVENDETQEDLKDIQENFASEALRVLAVSYKTIQEVPGDSEEEREELEKDMTLAGMIGMIDPPRDESIESVQEAINAGIRPIMITGDHSITATAIAKQIGIADESSKTLTGSELQQMSDEEFNDQLEEYAVYARVSPEDKIRIVEAWQNKGEVVAMTGDGVNDAPSLQSANVGTAMGDNGTEVAKNASDMILTDDNFETIVHAVEEGRRVYENIRKTVYFLLAANVAEIVVMLLTALLGWGTPLLPVHLLYINVIADGLPGFGFSIENAEDDIMKRKPIEKEASIFADGGYRRIGVGASTFIIGTMIAFYVGTTIELGGLAPSLEVGQTMAFLTLGWGSIIQIFVIRKRQSILKTGIMENKFIFWTAIFAVLLTGVIGAVPFLADIFSLVQISGMHWLLAAGLSLLIIPVVEIDKWFIRKQEE